MRKTMLGAILATVAGLGACENKLVVTNPNAGETERVLGTPADAENLLGSYYKRFLIGVYGSDSNIEGMANIFSLMTYSSLANGCQNSHAPFVGAANVNNPGNTCKAEQFRLYSISNEVTRVASTILSKLDSGLTLGTDQRNKRARTFAEFLRGVSLGYVAMMHDSGAIVSPKMGAGDDCRADPFTGVCTGPLRPYTQVADSAYVALQRALDYAGQTGSGSDGFPLPGAWMPSSKTFTQAEFQKLVRSYRARLRANVARTPSERAAADWNAIIADVDGGITFDDSITTSTTTFNVMAYRSAYGGLSTRNMPPFFYGMADGGTNYAAWIATPLGDRGSGNSSFFMVSPDLRFPQGATRAAQQADFKDTSCQVPGARCKRYFVNRIVDDFSGTGWSFSNYFFLRFESWRTRGDNGSAQNGSTPIMMLSEIRLLKAEGLYRKGDYAGAAAIVNESRTRTVDANGNAIGGGLPAITAFDATSPVPGGAACVPKVPQPPAFNTVGCGTLWDALKYEFRMETAYTTYIPWYLAGRGWGDMPEGVPLFWAVPYQDLQARGYKIAELYGAGPGVGNAPGSVSGKSAYGW